MYYSGLNVTSKAPRKTTYINFITSKKKGKSPIFEEYEETNNITGQYCEHLSFMIIKELGAQPPHVNVSIFHSKIVVVFF